MKHSKGFRSRSRHKLRGGRFSIAEALKKLSDGARVVVKLNPSVHSGMPHPKYHGQQGIVEGRRGRAYLVSINDGNKNKTLLARPEHLLKVKEQVKK
ncbi:TPA: 50S ribosomal protein L21e [archaeon]|nr:50S ribosomal protein L21e [Candidatus Undinarchaeales archaeon SRR5007147.bin71]